MFLYRLREEQKLLFLQLARHGVGVDRRLHRRELAKLEEICREMMLPYDENAPLTELEEVLHEINAITTPRERQAMLYEIMSLLLADRTLADDEKNFLRRVRRAMGLPRSKEEDFWDLIEQYQELCAEIREEVHRLD